MQSTLIVRFRDVDASAFPGELELERMKFTILFSSLFSFSSFNFLAFVYYSETESLLFSLFTDKQQIEADGTRIWHKVNQRPRGDTTDINFIKQ